VILLSTFHSFSVGLLFGGRTFRTCPAVEVSLSGRISSVAFRKTANFRKAFSPPKHIGVTGRRPRITSLLFCPDKILPTKFEVSIAAHYEDMNRDTKWGNGVVWGSSGSPKVTVCTLWCIQILLAFRSKYVPIWHWHRFWDSEAF